MCLNYLIIILLFFVRFMCILVAGQFGGVQDHVNYDRCVENITTTLADIWLKYFPNLISKWKVEIIF